MMLRVYYQDHLVGTIVTDADNRMRFEYQSSWWETPGCFTISASLPKSGNYTRGREDHRFFTNLLPEAGARENICRSLGISPTNDAGLLAAIGGECAGALRIVPEGSTPEEFSEYELLEESTIQRAIRGRIAYTGIGIKGHVRLSLAGAQDKWPVFYKDERLYWPVGTAPSSHILKLADPRFKGLAMNEAFVHFLALKAGLPGTEVIPKNGYTLSKRYDRIEGSGGELIRLHQEDFCQALGYGPATKYEAEGGPDLAACAGIIRHISSSPAEDILNLLRWHVFNLLAGNSDGHAKNIAILYTPEGPRLAPFYDLVCTGVYTGITRDMAFSTGRNHDPGQIRKADWEHLAGSLGVNARLIFRIIEEQVDHLQVSLAPRCGEFSEIYGADPIIERIRQHITRQIRRSRNLLGD